MLRRSVLLLRSRNIAWTAVLGMLASLSDVTLVGDVTTGTALLEAAAHLAPEIVIAGWKLDEGDALPVLTALHADRPACQLAVIGGQFSEGDIEALALI